MIRGEPRTVDLDGLWLFRPDPKGLGEHFAEELHYTHAADARWMSEDHDDSAWSPAAVPSCWQEYGHPDLQIGWYRRRFSDPRSEAGQRVSVRFEGVIQEAEVWVNGRLVGSHEGYFEPFEIDVTDRLCADNLLAVRVHAPVDVLGEEHEQGQLKSVFTGALGRWDMNDPETKPGGIWSSVRLLVVDAVRVRRLRVDGRPRRTPPRGDPAAAVPVAVDCTVELDNAPAADGLPATCRIEIRRQGAGSGLAIVEHPIELRHGRQVTTAHLRVDAELWWTWDLGTPCLHDVHVAVEVHRAVAARASVTTGFRLVERGDGQELRLNGVRVFQRGANYLSQHLPSRRSETGYLRDVQLAVDANLNTLHPFCAVESPAFYAACDAAGILVYQDVPMWMMMSNHADVVRRGLAQVDAMHRHLQHHPSCLVWNLGSQPSAANFEKFCSAAAQRMRSLDPAAVVSQANTTFAYHGEDVHPVRSLFWSAERGARYADNDDWRYDAHVYTGWYFDELDELGAVPAEHLALVTEFGAQALPGRDGLAELGIDPADKTVNWGLLARRCAQPALLRRRLGDIEDLDELIAASQAYQAMLVRAHVEHYRRHKFQPCNGAHVFAFVDCWPAVTWSVLDHGRRPKPAYRALACAMSPLQVFAEPLPRCSVGEAQAIRAAIVNDLAVAHRGLGVRARLSASDAAQQPVELGCHVDVRSGGLEEVEVGIWSPTQAGPWLLEMWLEHPDVPSAEPYMLGVSARPA